MRASDGATFLILDLRRVTMIDASGALMLDRVTRRLKDQGTRLLVAHINATGKLGRSVHGAGVFTGRDLPDWFADTDQALEWAEMQLLEGGTLRRRDRARLSIGDFALMEGLSPDELAFMKPYLDRQLFPARAALYHEGQQGDRLYLLARGAVSIVTEDPDDHAKHRRVVTLAPGVIFGESAMIEGGVRSVTAIAEDEVVTYSLSRRNLDAIRAVNAGPAPAPAARRAGAPVRPAAHGEQSAQRRRRCHALDGSDADAPRSAGLDRPGRRRLPTTTRWPARGRSACTG